MPTLLQINSTANCGSTGRIAEDLGKVALSEGWKSYIAFGRDSRPSESKLIKIGNNFDFYKHLIVTRLFDRHCFCSTSATKNFINKIEEIKPDIIQFQNVHGYYLNLKIIMEYIAQKDIPLVWSLHDCWSMTGHCSHFATINCEKWKTQCENCSQIHSYPSSWWWDSSKRNFIEKKKLIEAVPRLSIISASKWLANIAKQSFFKNRDIYVIPDGIDTDIYSPQDNINDLKNKYGLNNKFVIMASGTVWLPYKGINDFAKLRNVLSEDYAIIFVGMPDNDIKKLPHGIIGIPRTKNPQELARWYSLADCVMSLSKLESFGLTPVEGFSCGTPAIVYNSTALPELITPENGYVVEIENIQDLKQKVEKIKNIGKQNFTKTCREIALNKYDKNICYKSYLNIYKSMLN